MHVAWSFQELDFYDERAFTALAHAAAAQMTRFSPHVQGVKYTYSAGTGREVHIKGRYRAVLYRVCSMHKLLCKCGTVRYVTPCRTMCSRRCRAGAAPSLQDTVQGAMRVKY